MADPEIIFPIGNYLGNPYFMPPVGFNETQALARLTENNKRNMDLLEKLPPEKRNSASHIDVSFIYGQPADYHGMPMLNASIGDWKKVFSRFKTMKIDTVIFQAALWRELRQCFYQSKHFSDMHCYEVLERMFAAAEEMGIHVFLGGYGSVAGWKEHFTQEELNKELNNHKKCFEELYRLGKIDGMYFPSETAFKDIRKPEKEKRMNSLYRFFSDMVKEKDPDLKIIVSPATMHDPALNGMFKDFWNAVLTDSNIDILMPQDSIGTNCSRLDQMDQQWHAWKEVADFQKIALWSHTEIFERRGYRPEHSLYPAAPERIAAQLALVAPYTTRHCCWEALYFTSDECGEEGKRLRKFMTDGM